MLSLLLLFEHYFNWLVFCQKEILFQKEANKDQQEG
jgi:hypothetical protein